MARAPIERVTILVMDSAGVGEMPDANVYGDEGSNTIANTARFNKGLRIPNLAKLGLGRLTTIEGVQPEPEPVASFGKMAEASPGKDTTTGHWEMAGVILKTPLPLYPKGFPKEILDEFKRQTGLDVLGNKPASGTEIIMELGDEHVRTGFPIVYTSADSVFQMACHEGVVPLKRLYELSEIARKILDPYGTARVIARPFTGEKGAYTRTKNRRDFSLNPPEETVLDRLKAAKIQVTGVGKIRDIYNGQGIGDSVTAKDNTQIADATIDLLDSQKKGLIFSNFVDFDMLWGHRNNAKGYADGLEAFDVRLGQMLQRLDERDMLIITADHGCDPTDVSTDHTREYVPLLVYYGGRKKGVDLGIRTSFTDIGQTLADVFGVAKMKNGTSFLPQIRAD
jgi:phosphopentomutase